MLHAGHVEYLRMAKSRGDILIVGVNDDASVRRLKGEPRPINQLADRMTVLSALEMVDAVVPFTEDTPLEIVIISAILKGMQRYASDTADDEMADGFSGELARTRSHHYYEFRERLQAYWSRA